MNPEENTAPEAEEVINETAEETSAEDTVATENEEVSDTDEQTA